MMHRVGAHPREWGGAPAATCTLQWGEVLQPQALQQAATGSGGAAGAGKTHGAVGPPAGRCQPDYTLGGAAGGGGGGERAQRGRPGRCQAALEVQLRRQVAVHSARVGPDVGAAGSRVQGAGAGTRPGCGRGVVGWACRRVGGAGEGCTGVRECQQRPGGAGGGGVGALRRWAHPPEGLWWAAARGAPVLHGRGHREPCWARQRLQQQLPPRPLPVLQPEGSLQDGPWGCLTPPCPPAPADRDGGYRGSRRVPARPVHPARRPRLSRPGGDTPPARRSRHDPAPGTRRGPGPAPLRTGGGGGPRPRGGRLARRLRPGGGRCCRRG